MARTCAICEKGSQMEWKRKLLRGNYNPTHKVRKHPNLQWVHVFGDAAKRASLPEGARVKACTQCMKRLYKT